MPPPRGGASNAPSLRQPAAKNSDVEAFRRGMLEALLAHLTSVDFKIYGHNGTEIENGHEGLINALATLETAHVVIVTPNIEEVDDVIDLIGDIDDAAVRCGHRVTYVEPALWRAAVAGNGKLEPEPDLLIVPHPGHYLRR